MPLVAWSTSDIGATALAPAKRRSRKTWTAASLSWLPPGADRNVGALIWGRGRFMDFIERVYPEAECILRVLIARGCFLLQSN
jgi:hypothetical protein